MLLAEQPASGPREPAVDLIIAAGQLQNFLEATGLAPPNGTAAALDVDATFGPIVFRWIAALRVIADLATDFGLTYHSPSCSEYTSSPCLE